MTCFILLRFTGRLEPVPSWTVRFSTPKLVWLRAGSYFCFILHHRCFQFPGIPSVWDRHFCHSCFHLEFVQCPADDPTPVYHHGDPRGSLLFHSPPYLGGIPSVTSSLCSDQRGYGFLCVWCTGTPSCYVLDCLRGLFAQSAPEIFFDVVDPGLNCSCAHDPFLRCRDYRLHACEWQDSSTSPTPSVCWWCITSRGFSSHDGCLVPHWVSAAQDVILAVNLWRISSERNGCCPILDISLAAVVVGMSSR